jgi:hypothetical protein
VIQIVVEIVYRERAAQRVSRELRATATMWRMALDSATIAMY